MVRRAFRVVREHAQPAFRKLSGKLPRQHMNGWSAAHFGRQSIWRGWAADNGTAATTDYGYCNEPQVAVENRNGTRSELERQSLAGCRHPGKVLLRLFDDLVDALVAVIRIMVEEHQVLDFALRGDAYAFAQWLCPQPRLRASYFLGQVLRVVDQHVGALGEFPYSLIETGSPVRYR